MSEEKEPQPDIEGEDFNRNWDKLLEDDRYHDKNELIEKKFNGYKKHWKNQMDELFPMLRNFDNLGEVEVLYLSYRHQVNDTLFTLMSKHSKKSQLKKKLKKKMMMHKKVKRAFSTKKAKKMYVSSYMSGLERHIELLEAWIEYCRSLIDTIDKISFSINHRIKYEEMK